MPLQCPLPRFDYDKIMLGHGSGGLLTHKLLESGVFQLFQNDLLDQQHDGASFTLNGPVAFSTDSYVVTPLFFPGGNIGDLAVNGTINDLAMCGAEPKYLSLSFILEEGLAMEEFATILATIHDATTRAGVKIVTGDTKVVEKGKGDKMFINTAGIGLIHPKAAIHHRHIRPGDAIILSGPLAQHGIAIMSLREGLRFETSIQSDTRALHHCTLPLLERFGPAIRFWRDPTRGGLASVLNELAGLTQLGYVLRQDALPLDPQVEGACEMLGLDPLYIANEGSFVAVVQREEADAFLAALRNTEEGSGAALIGEVTTAHPGKVVVKSPIGGQRVAGFLPGEQLPRIC